MAEVKDLLIYLIEAYDDEDKLSKARLTKLVYLCDWKNSIEYGKQITNIDWVFDNYGPFVWDVMKVVENNPRIFRTKNGVNVFGNDKTLVSVDHHAYEKISLTKEEKKVLSFVVESTKKMTWSEFIKLVYSTYPVVASIRHDKLNLVDFAREYKETPFYKDISPEIEYGRLESVKDDDF